MELYTKDNIKDLKFPDNENAEYTKNYLVEMIKNGINVYIKNVNADLMILKVDEIVLPVVVTTNNYDDSYVASTYTQYISYAKEELKELKNPRLENLLDKVLSILGNFLRKYQINESVYVNNWFLSTNLYPQLSKQQLIGITKFLKGKFPTKAIIFRSVNDFSTKDLYNNLNNIGYGKIGSRQVYFSTKLAELKKSQRKKIKNDFKKIEDENYELLEVKNTDEMELERLLELYDLLYIKQYSSYNPQFTIDYFKMGLSKELFTFKMLKKKDKIDGVLGYFYRNGIMTTPILGYDTGLPLETGLYRMLTSSLNIESEKNNFLLHRSSGAAKFKKNRGAVSSLEYNLVFYKHLSIKHQIGWKVLKLLINKIAIPLIKKQGL